MRRILPKLPETPVVPKHSRVALEGRRVYVSRWRCFVFIHRQSRELRKPKADPTLTERRVWTHGASSPVNSESPFLFVDFKNQHLTFKQNSRFFLTERHEKILHSCWTANKQIKSQSYFGSVRPPYGWENISAQNYFNFFFPITSVTLWCFFSSQQSRKWMQPSIHECVQITPADCYHTSKK